MVIRLTVSLCMKPQIPAATSQANKMTRQAKNCKREQKHHKSGPHKDLFYDSCEIKDPCAVFLESSKKNMFVKSID